MPDRYGEEPPDELVERVAGALHDQDCGWNCQGHGIMQQTQDEKYRVLAKVALRAAVRALGEADTDQDVAD